MNIVTRARESFRSLHAKLQTKTESPSETTTILRDETRFTYCSSSPERTSRANFSRKINNTQYGNTILQVINNIIIKKLHKIIKKTQQIRNKFTTLIMGLSLTYISLIILFNSFFMANFLLMRALRRHMDATFKQRHSNSVSLFCWSPFVPF